MLYKLQKSTRQQLIFEEFQSEVAHHSMARARLNKSEKVLTSTTTASKYKPNVVGMSIEKM